MNHQINLVSKRCFRAFKGKNINLWLFFRNKKCPLKNTSTVFQIIFFFILVRSEAKATTLDLTEWVDHRILARRDDYFCPGIIKAAYKDNSIAVDFESEETPLIYSNVLSRGDFDTIISDAVPATNQVY